MNGSIAFSCSLPREMLSNSSITDENFWMLNEHNILGQPVPDVVKVLYITFQIVTTGLLMRQLWCKDNEALLHDRGYFNAYIICSISLAITVFLFGFLIIFTRDFFYGTNDITRCNLCATAGFFFVLVNTFSLHCYACWYFSTMIILVFIYKKRTSHVTIRQWLENTSRITFRIKFPLLAVVVIVCVGVAVAPLAGFGQYEFDQDLGLCVPRVTGISHRSGTKNRAFITLLAVESLVPITACAVYFSSTCSHLSHYSNIAQLESWRLSINSVSTRDMLLASDLVLSAG